MARGAKCARIAGKRGAERRAGPKNQGNRPKRTTLTPQRPPSAPARRRQAENSRFFEVSGSYHVRRIVHHSDGLVLLIAIAAMRMV